MMASRTAGKEPAYPQPSRDEFHRLTEDQRNQITEAFTVFDADKDARIDYHEFRFSLRALGFDLPKQETFPYLTKFAQPPAAWPRDKECSPIWREFTLPVFQGIAGKLMAERDPDAECRRAYRLFDTDNKGVITVEDLRRVMKEIGQSMEETELAAMIREFDAEGKGGVNEEEFVKIMMAKRQA
ncbi:Calcium-binding component of the spindle pole body (SPB) half-bridge [Sporothrix bragantina]|uniref:Calcium-binding component of the spindle pole body (SPB) half-bridge n=1 Tax=Sporothrix bragantina TaxID=671064 RepID=A0ABP0C5T7_9PEZI